MRPRSVSDDQILAAARACLFARGPSATIDEIARQVGVSGPAILKRFGSKERLVMQALVSEELPDLSQGPQPGPLRSQLVAVLLQLERLVQEAVPKLATLRAGGVKASERIAQAPPRLARQHLRSWLERARRSHGLAHADPAAAADMLVSVVEARGFLSWIDPTWVDGGRQWAPRAVDALFGEVMRTLTRPRPASAPTATPRRARARPAADRRRPARVS